MAQESILTLHPAFGILALIAAAWVFIESYRASAENAHRVRAIAVSAATLMWLCYFTGNNCYVFFHPTEIDVINAGRWPFALYPFVEVKGYMFHVLLLFVTLLPFLTHGDIIKNRSVRIMVLWTSASVVLMALAIDGAGMLMPNLETKVAVIAR